MITFWVSWNGWPHLFFLLFRCRKAAYIILRRWKLAPLVIWIGPVSGTLELFLLESTKIMNLEILIKKYLIFYWWNAASKLNTLASCYDRKCFCRTWILWRSFPYRLGEWDKGYIYIISWLEQGCCFCEQLQHWEILAGKKILCILFCNLFMNSSYAYFLIKNLFCSLELKIELFFYSGTGTTVCSLCSRSDPQTWRQHCCMYSILILAICFLSLLSLYISMPGKKSVNTSNYLLIASLLKKKRNIFTKEN